MKLKITLFALILSNIVLSQNVGIGTTSPTNTLHVVPLGPTDPLRVQGLQGYSSEQNFLIVDPTSGIVKHMHIDSLRLMVDSDLDSVRFNNDSIYIYENGTVVKTYIKTSLDTALIDSLIYAKVDSFYNHTSDSLLRDFVWLNELRDSVDSDVDSVRYFNDSLYIYENGSVVKTYINTTYDTILTDSLIYAKVDSFYIHTSDSLLRDLIWLNELRDSIDSDVDSANLISDSTLVIHENGNPIYVDLRNLRDSSEWIDGKFTGLNAGTIYARKALATGDTVTITPVYGLMGIGTSNPQAGLDIRKSHNQHLFIGQQNQGGNIRFARGTDGSYLGRVGFESATIDDDFGIVNASGGGEVNVKTNAGSTTGGHFSVSSFGGTAPGTHLMVLNTGLTGISKIDPQSKLDVNHAKDVTSGAVGIKDWLSITTGADVSTGNHMGLTMGVDTMTNKSYIQSRLTGANQIRPLDFNDSALFVSSLTNNRYVGIGTSNPTGHLDVRGGFYNQVRIGSRFAPGGVRFSDYNGSYSSYIGYQDFNSVDTFLIQNGSGGSVVKIKTNGGLPSGFGGGFFVENLSTGNPGVFFVVRNTGNVGVGTINPSERLEVCGNAKIVGQIQANSSNLSAGLTCSSDKRLKTNIQSISKALDKVRLIKGKTYNWRVNEFPNRGFTNELQYGFIAQELEVNFPELVKTNSDGYKTVDYLEVIPLLTEAIKEQQDIIDIQQKEIEQLKEELKKSASLKDVLELKAELDKIKSSLPKN